MSSPPVIIIQRSSGIAKSPRDRLLVLDHTATVRPAPQRTNNRVEINPNETSGTIPITFTPRLPFIQKMRAIRVGR